MAVPVLEIHSHCSTFVSVVNSDFFKNQDFFLRTPPRTSEYFSQPMKSFLHTAGASQQLAKQGR